MVSDIDITIAHYSSTLNITFAAHQNNMKGGVGVREVAIAIDKVLNYKNFNYNQFHSV